jgi:hypothetical protein
MRKVSVLFSLCLDRFSVAADISEGYKGNRKYDLLPEVKSSDDVEKGAASVTEATTGSTPQPQDKPRELSKSIGRSVIKFKLLLIINPSMPNMDHS